MPVFLDMHTVASDLPREDILWAARRVNEVPDVQMLLCGYNRDAGKVWCVTMAPDATAMRRAHQQVDFAFYCDEVMPLDELLDPAAIDLQNQAVIEGVTDA